MVIEHTSTMVEAVEKTMVLSGIAKYYSGVPALLDVSLEVRAGEVHALLGENGAGKSTLMGVASGTTQPDAGTLRFGETDVAHLTPPLATALGIAIVHQHPAVLPDLTVGGEHPARGARGVPQVRRYSGRRDARHAGRTWVRRLTSMTGSTP